MTTTLADLEQRLAALEEEMKALRRLVAERSADEPPEARGARLWHQAAMEQVPMAVGWALALRQMGVQGQPLGAEKVQEMMAAGGVQPEDNEFSRGIIEMREE